VSFGSSAAALERFIDHAVMIKIVPVIILKITFNETEKKIPNSDPGVSWFGYGQPGTNGRFKDLACVAMSENPIRRKFSRHMDIRRYFMRDMVSCWCPQACPSPYSFNGCGSAQRISFQQIYRGPNAVVSRIEGWRYLLVDLSDYFIF
jgi:hypothetical protein